MSRAGWAALASILAVAITLRADDWAGPVMTHVFSGDGRRFVKVIPGKSIGDTYGFSGSPKGPWATAEIYEQRKDKAFVLVARITLRNPVAPVDVLVSNTGAFMTLDNWHNVGYGEVVAIFHANGQLLRSFRLTDLIAESELGAVPTSVSSRWWRCKPMGFSDPDKQTTVYVADFRGGNFVFDLTRGTYKYERGTAKCAP